MIFLNFLIHFFVLYKTLRFWVPDPALNRRIRIRIHNAAWGKRQHSVSVFRFDPDLKKLKGGLKALYYKKYISVEMIFVEPIQY